MKKEDVRVLFFFIPAFCLAIVSSTVDGHIFLWLGILFLVLIYINDYLPPPVLSPLSFGAFALFIAVIANIIFVSPLYSAKGVYYLCYFLGGFLLFDSITRQQLASIYKFCLGLFALLSCWALFTYFTGYGVIVPNRAPATIFTTVNTFAAALYLVGMPLFILYLYDQSRGRCYPLLLLLYAGFLATQSRGAFLACIIGLIICWLTSQWYGLVTIKPHRKKLLIGIILISIAFSFYETIKTPAEDSELSLLDGASTLFRTEQSFSGDQRLLFYEVAIQEIKQNPYTGYGYLNFRHYFHRDKPAYVYGQNIYGGFVHNDYLQTWLETGLPGILALIVIIWAFYRQVILFKRSQPRQEDQILVVSLVAGMSAYFCHALVDFVMYPPALLFLFGAYLGLTNQLTTGNPNRKEKSRITAKLASFGIRPAVQRGMIGLVIMAWLAQPAIAQSARDLAVNNTNNFKFTAALSNYEIARRFAPYESEYYFLEGKIWLQAAINNGNVDAAEQADKMFDEGATHNPFNIENRLVRAILHRDYPELLHLPASLAIIAEWFEYILRWHPVNNQVVAEYVKTLRLMGRDDKANKVLENALKYYPHSPLLLALQNNANEQYDLQYNFNNELNGPEYSKILNDSPGNEDSQSRN